MITRRLEAAERALAIAEAILIEGHEASEIRLPLIGRVSGVEGAYIATGHSVWGILNAPATGEAMAELITEGVAHT